MNIFHLESVVAGSFCFMAWLHQQPTHQRQAHLQGTTKPTTKANLAKEL
jgi:hypothetical protein